jgi:hypothetical protein
MKYGNKKINLLNRPLCLQSSFQNDNESGSGAWLVPLFSVWYLVFGVSCLVFDVSNILTGMQ